MLAEVIPEYAPALQFYQIFELTEVTICTSRGQDPAPRIGRPAKTPLENLDRGLAENHGVARLALAKAVINEENPRNMGRPARSVEEVSAEYDKRKPELDQSISNLEAGLAEHCQMAPQLPNNQCPRTVPCHLEKQC